MEQTHWKNIQQTGEGSYAYNEPNLSYNQELSEPEQLPVKYNHLGEDTNWTHLLSL